MINNRTDGRHCVEMRRMDIWMVFVMLNLASGCAQMRERKSLGPQGENNMVDANARWDVR